MERERDELMDGWMDTEREMDKWMDGWRERERTCDFYTLCFDI